MNPLVHASLTGPTADHKVPHNVTRSDVEPISGLRPPSNGASIDKSGRWEHVPPHQAVAASSHIWRGRSPHLEVDAVHSLIVVHSPTRLNVGLPFLYLPATGEGVARHDGLAAAGKTFNVPPLVRKGGEIVVCPAKANLS